MHFGTGGIYWDSVRITIGSLQLFPEAHARTLKFAIVGLAALGGLAAFLFTSPVLQGMFKEGVLFLFGGVSLFAGFAVLRKKRMIENVPASRIRSVAMGLAELSGAVRQKTAVTAPITGTPCCYFRYTIEKLTGGKNRHWEVVERGASNEPFLLEDPTGRILVDPAGADTVLRTAHREVRRDGGLFGAQRRYTEWRLVAGQRIYVLGSVRKQRDAALERRVTLTDRLRSLKQDPEGLSRFDADGDGAISAPEWDRAVAAVKEGLTREEAARGPVLLEEDLVIGRGDAETTFVIADRGEKHLVRSLNLQVGVALLLAVLFILVPTVSLLARAGALPEALSLGTP